MKSQYDLVIIGAGPAGLAAAVTADKFGLSTLVLDEQQIPGGQIYRSIEKTVAENAPVLGTDYFYGQALVQTFRSSGADYLPGANIWDLCRDLTIGYLVDDQARQVKARHILIAAGAMERPVPIPGWTLPGVMGAAAADILFKSCDMVPEGPVVLAGSGPLQLLVACRLIDNGVKVAAMVETNRFSDNLKGLPYLPQALRVSQYLTKGLAMRWKVHRAEIPIFQNATNLRIEGDDSAEALCFSSRGKVHRIPAKTVLLHEGVVPNLQLTRLLDCDHQWYERQRYWKPVLDSWGQTSVNGISVAGDAGGIFGAKSAEAAGHLASIGISSRLKVISAQEKEAAAAPWLKMQKKEMSIRPFLDTIFPPGKQALVPPEDTTLVCRCEEITAGQIREAVALGALSPSQVKAQTRAGMGPCQGRMCGLTVAEIIAASRQVMLPEVGHTRVRPPLKPITLGQLANLEVVD
jgi:thioredoxin reductase/bacterioferritin-associated ferredoxin